MTHIPQFCELVQTFAYDIDSIWWGVRCCFSWGLKHMLGINILQLKCVDVFSIKFQGFWMATLGKLSYKKNGKKRGHCPLVGGGVNPSSFFKPKFTGLSNHSEMNFWHHNSQKGTMSPFFTVFFLHESFPKDGLIITYAQSINSQKVTKVADGRLSTLMSFLNGR